MTQEPVEPFIAAMSARANCITWKAPPGGRHHRVDREARQRELTTDPADPGRVMTGSAFCAHFAGWPLPLIRMLSVPSLRLACTKRSMRPELIDRLLLLDSFAIDLLDPQVVLGLAAPKLAVAA